MQPLNFRCKECGHTVLETVAENVTVYQLVVIFPDGGEEYEGRPAIFGGDFIGYRCEKCGTFVKDDAGDDIQDPGGMAHYLWDQPENAEG